MFFLATFSENGPEKCSGLPIKQYSSEEMTRLLAPHFEALSVRNIDHVTPWGAKQNLTVGLFQKIMDRSELEQLLFRQKQAFKREVPGYERRIEALRKLSSILEEHQEELIHAVARDFGWRSHDETLLLEIYPLQDEIRHAIKNLKSWMKSRRVSGSWFLYPAKAFYQYQPKGCVGIMGAWNYQLMLCLSPMIDALAAGNHILLKPSEIAPHSAGLLKRLLNANFDEAYVSCVTGDADTARNFSALGFDHLFFTGSTTTGKKGYGSCRT